MNVLLCCSQEAYFAHSVFLEKYGLTVYHAERLSHVFDWPHSGPPTIQAVFLDIETRICINISERQTLKFLEKTYPTMLLHQTAGGFVMPMGAIPAQVESRMASFLQHIQLLEPKTLRTTLRKDVHLTMNYTVLNAISADSAILAQKLGLPTFRPTYAMNLSESGAYIAPTPNLDRGMRLLVNLPQVNIHQPLIAEVRWKTTRVRGMTSPGAGLLFTNPSAEQKSAIAQLLTGPKKDTIDTPPLQVMNYL